MIITGHNFHHHHLHHRHLHHRHLHYHLHRHHRHLVKVRKKVKMESVDRNSPYGETAEGWDGARFLKIKTLCMKSDII